jgi:CRISPR-associated endonuclease/helicase Cas3
VIFVPIQPFQDDLVDFLMIDEKRDTMEFRNKFESIIGFPPLKWQLRLYEEYMRKGKCPVAVDIPTGLGKTSIMAIWFLALKAGACLPRRLVYVVDRRAVVDQATTVAENIKMNASDETLRISTLRGQHADNRQWLEDPAAPAIVVGTIDMVGSRLLFSGYGISRKMRPYNAGMLGRDTLVVLDESHLVPPFEKLLDQIETGVQVFAPRAETDCVILPPFKLLSLSATGRDREGVIFRLEKNKGDLEDEIVQERLAAKKGLLIELANDRKMEEALSEYAWKLSESGHKAVRILVYCDERKTAEKVHDTIKKMAEGDKKTGSPKVEIDTELFVGARRVKERIDAEDRLKKLGFLAGSRVQLDKPAFLIATSAGEVGVDLDADHMVCDLVPWERLAQRFGRVNRLGKGDAQIILVHGNEPKPKNPDVPTQQELREMIAWQSRDLLEQLPRTENGIDVSPGALRELKHQAENDIELRKHIDAATTPPPLYPSLTRALVDAWSMTSLEQHTGRPEVGPWLRGWVEDTPQAAVVWRKFLPVRVEGGPASPKEIEEFFEAAPLHLSEILETETWRVSNWMQKRIQAWQLLRTNEQQDIVAFTLGTDGNLCKMYSVQELIEIGTDKERKKQFDAELIGVTLVVDARLGGLEAGLLKPDASAEGIRTADDGEPWPTELPFRIRSVLSGTGDAAAEFRIAHTFATRRTVEGEVVSALQIETKNTEESQSEAKCPQLLEDHHSSAERHARRLAAAIGLPDNYTEALGIAARLHDAGKQSRHWQRAFNAKGDGIYAKTQGPFFSSRLGGYRHEFGTLAHTEHDEAFRHLPPELQELVLHLIAAHHGRARPIIAIEGCDDAPPSVLKTRARDVALRFARLQKQWGPWGLAWWEAMLRAADQQASRENDKGGDTHGRS